MTRPSVRAIGAALVAVLLAFVTAPIAPAQGVTSAAVTGKVTDQAGNPIAAASVEIVNASTGQRYQARTSSDGRFFFENVGVGGPYTITVRALGHEPQSTPGMTLTLGERKVQDFTLRQVAVEVGAVSVTAEMNPLINQARTGAQGFVSEQDLARLPTLGRNFTDFIVTVPQVVTNGVPGATIGGQNNRFNNIQIDGGVNNDLFGLAASGTPGGQANAHPISVEAVKEYQVLVAPFDVRQAGFTGGLVNAVTKSGTNAYHGSLFGFLQNQSLVGEDPGGNPQADFHQNQLGGSFGGPLIRDRLHFFLSGDVQDRAAPFVGERTGNNGISTAYANRVREILQSDARYGFDPGFPEAPTQGNPDRNFFGKLTLQVGANSSLEFSHNFVDAANDNLIRNAAATGFRDGYQLSNSGYSFASQTNTTRAIFTARPGGALSNELIVSRQSVRDSRDLPNRVPLLFVQGEQTGRNIAAGADRFSHENFLDQDIVEITDNLTFSAGSHLLTVGTHNEFFGFVNGFFPASLGVWSFADTTALLNGTPNRYEIAVPRRPGGPTADFSVQQLGFYVQDRWSATPRLTLTAGLRVDLPRMDAPSANPLVALRDTLGVNTGAFPESNALWSPRVGFNFDVAGTGQTIVRGGLGVFSGRPPYVWLSNAYSNTGLEQATLICDGGAAGYLDTVPAFTIDPDNQPQACGGGLVTAAAAAASIVYFDEDFRFPQNLKLALGMDQEMPWGMVGTLDLLYTKSMNQFYIEDVNLQGIVGYSAGEGGRPLYGALSATSTTSTPARITSAVRDVLRHRNESQDRSWSITAQVQKRFSDRLGFNVGYTYSRTEDLFSLTSSIASSNYRFTSLDGTLENRNLRLSAFDIPHKFTVSGTVAAPWGINASLIYIRQSGHPYSFMVQDDANGDSFGGNDLVYVPRGRNDVTVDGNGIGTTASTTGLGTVLQQDSVWGIINGFIERHDCLRAHRGSILPRNSCRTGPISFLNMRLSKAIPMISGHQLELSIDAFNVLYMLDNDWSVQREYSAFEQVNFVRRNGYDAVNQRGIYALGQIPNTTNPLLPTLIESARWRLQLSARYAF
jgi:outer membrane receptor protein involved in Fe transport